jgi:hypothetical protein
MVLLTPLVQLKKRHKVVPSLALQQATRKEKYLFSRIYVVVTSLGISELVYIPRGGGYLQMQTPKYCSPLEIEVSVLAEA